MEICFRDNVLGSSEPLKPINCIPTTMKRKETPSTDVMRLLVSHISGI